MTQDKQHNRPNVPPLRFPEFTEPWETAKLGAIAEFSKGTGISKEQRSETGLPCILYGELYTTYTNEVIEDVVSKTDLDPTDLVKSQKNDVIIPSSGETAEDIATARCVTSDNVLLGGDLNIIRLVEPNDGRFMSYQLNGIRKYDIAKIAQGVSVVHLYGGDLKMLSVTFPQSPEQKKIADCISLLDRRISVQIGLIEDLQKLKAALVERLFCNKQSWKQYKYRDLLSPISERNSENQFSNVLSASQELGMVNRTDLDIDIKFERSAVTTYKIVRDGDYVLHLRSFQGGLAFSSMTGICSPAYTILRPVKELEYGFFQEYFMSRSFINSLRLVTYGIRDGRSINVDEFLDMPVEIPDSATQCRIISILSIMNRRLRLAIKQNENFIKQKQYLLQQLFI